MSSTASITAARPPGGTSGARSAWRQRPGADTLILCIVCRDTDVTSEPRAAIGGMGTASGGSSADADGFACPICGSDTLEDFNGRRNVRCVGCRTVERHRLLWMLLERFSLFREDMRVLHVAPEIPLGRRFTALCGDLYHPCDLDAAKYAKTGIPARPIDLCRDLAAIPDESYDLILHSHVLEHISCDVEGVMRQIERILAPGGRHVFSVPVRGTTTQEDLSAGLSPEERTRRFGQHDHMRIFGSASLREMLAAIWPDDPSPLIEPHRLFTAEALTRAAIPQTAWSGITSNSFFLLRKAPRADRDRDVRH